MADKSKYNVVFEYNERAKPGYRGNRYRVSFESEAEFEEGRSLDDEAIRMTDVVAKGVSDEQLLELCEQVNDRRLIAYAIESATSPDGELNPFKLRMELGNVRFVLADRLRHRSGLQGS